VKTFVFTLLADSPAKIRFTERAHAAKRAPLFFSHAMRAERKEKASKVILAEVVEKITVILER
jgi:hypothetical protein